MKRARVIIDDSGSATGVIVRIIPLIDIESSVKSLAIKALAEHGDEYCNKLTMDRASEVLKAMSYCRTGSFRWIPCGRYCTYSFRIEDAEAGSRGSFIGRYWSYPY